MLEIVKSPGIDGVELRWLKHWLIGLKQRVVIKGQDLDWLDVTTGVPQGSVLGPVLFLVHFKDTNNGPCCKTVSSVDDTKLGIRATTETERLQPPADLHKLTDWPHKWPMNSDIDKWKVKTKVKTEKQTIVWSLLSFKTLIRKKNEVT